MPGCGAGGRYTCAEDAGLGAVVDVSRKLPRSAPNFDWLDPPSLKCLIDMQVLLSNRRERSDSCWIVRKPEYLFAALRAPTQLVA